MSELLSRLSFCRPPRIHKITVNHTETISTNGSVGKCGGTPVMCNDVRQMRRNSRNVQWCDILFTILQSYILQCEYITYCDCPLPKYVSYITYRGAWKRWFWFLCTQHGLCFGTIKTRVMFCNSQETWYRIFIIQYTFCRISVSRLVVYKTPYRTYKSVVLTIDSSNHTISLCDNSDKVTSRLFICSLYPLNNSSRYRRSF